MRGYEIGTPLIPQLDLYLSAHYWAAHCSSVVWTVSSSPYSCNPSVIAYVRSCNSVNRWWKYMSNPCKAEWGIYNESSNYIPMPVISSMAYVVICG